VRDPPLVDQTRVLHPASHGGIVEGRAQCQVFIPVAVQVTHVPLGHGQPQPGALDFLAADGEQVRLERDADVNGKVSGTGTVSVTAQLGVGRPRY
jgi:hypothetical protein